MDRLLNLRTRQRFHETANFFEDLIAGMSGGLATGCPRPAWMEFIPERSFATKPSGTWGMIAEAFHKEVPEWLKFLNDKRFAKGNPNIVHDERLIGKIRKVK